MKNQNSKYLTKYFWIFQICGWTVFGIIDSYIKWIDNLREIEYIIGSIVTYATGIIITTILHRFYKRYLTTSKTIFLIIINIVLVSIPATVFWIILDHICSIPIWGFKNTIFGYFALPAIEKFSSFFFNLVIMIAWSGLYFGIRNTIESTKQNERFEQTQILLELAQLKALRYQLNPHFLFNALSSLRMLIRKDSQRAEQMLNKIAEFLRYTISGKNSQEVPLTEEVNAIQQYLEIEKIRFEDKIDFRYSIDQLAEDFPIPVFLIHPIIENAIKYGMDSTDGKLEIELIATVKNDVLMIEISNTGKWNKSEQKDTGTGMGLKNVKKRLDFAFPQNNKLIINKTNGKVTVIIEARRKVEQD